MDKQVGNGKLKGIFFDPDQLEEDPKKYHRWAMKVKGTCVACGNPIYNCQDSVMLLDNKDQNKVLAWFHSSDLSGGKPCYWDWKKKNAQ